MVPPGLTPLSRRRHAAGGIHIEPRAGAARNEQEKVVVPKPDIIVTRHTAAVQFADKYLGLNGVPVMPHAAAADVKDKIVLGVLPFHLAALAREVIAIEIPDLPAEARGRELSVSEMEQYGARFVRYVVRVKEGT